MLWLKLSLVLMQVTFILFVSFPFVLTKYSLLLYSTYNVSDNPTSVYIGHTSYYEGTDMRMQYYMSIENLSLSYLFR